MAKVAIRVTRATEHSPGAGAPNPNVDRRALIDRELDIAVGALRALDLSYEPTGRDHRHAGLDPILLPSVDPYSRHPKEGGDFLANDVGGDRFTAEVLPELQKLAEAPVGQCHIRELTETLAETGALSAEGVVLRFDIHEVHVVLNDRRRGPRGLGGQVLDGTAQFQKGSVEGVGVVRILQVGVEDEKRDRHEKR